MKFMMPLYAGLLLLTAGIIFRVASLPWYPLIFIFSGASLKVIYVLCLIIKRDYKPGVEMLILLAGLILLLAGIYLDGNTDLTYPLYMKVGGISLKATFVLLFIVKTRRNRLPKD
jgi:hypothetical protein